MTTPPPADGVPDDSEAKPVWAPPDAPSARTVRPDAVTPAEPPNVHPEPPPPAGGAPAPVRTNRLAIVALITGLISMVPLAVGFAIAALVQIGRRGEKGKGIAIGALAAAVAWAAVIGVAVVARPPADRSGPGLASDVGQPRASTLKAGTCFVGFEEKGTGIFMTAAQCKGPHEGEIGAQAALRERPFPGGKLVLAEAEKVCQTATGLLRKTGRADEFRLYIDRPDKEVWEGGNRTVTCVLRYIGPNTIALPLKDILTGPREYTDLVVGDCVGKWDVTSVVPVVGCTAEHKIQVFAVFDLGGAELPSAEEMDGRAARGCAERAAKIWGSHPPRNVEPLYVGPNSVAWKLGERQIVCMFEVAKGSLTRSLMPE